MFMNLLLTNCIRVLYLFSHLRFFEHLQQLTRFQLTRRDVIHEELAFHKQNT